MTALRDALITIVRDRALTRLEEPIQLASGEWSRDFIDGKQGLGEGEHLELACRALLELVADEGIDFDAIGGLTMGADAFGHVVAVLARKKWFVIRKEPKGRGTNKMVEGTPLGPGVRVVVVDDVVTTGGSIRLACERIADTGAIIVGAVTLVDRGEVASKHFANLGIPYRALVTYRDLDITPVGHGLSEPPASRS